MKEDVMANGELLLDWGAAPEVLGWVEVLGQDGAGLPPLPWLGDPAPLEQVEENLLRKFSPFVLLWGPPGTGKTALVDEVVRRSRMGEGELAGRQVLRLDLELLVADVKDPFESLRSFWTVLRRHRDKVVLVLDPLPLGALGGDAGGRVAALVRDFGRLQLRAPVPMVV